MSKIEVENVAVENMTAIIAPGILKKEIPVYNGTALQVADHRQAVRRIINKDDSRMLVIVGPCSVHDVGEVLEYARLIAAAREEFSDKLEILMRVYGEKPRTTTGWPGFIPDPYLDGSMCIGDGLRMMRSLLREITQLGVPCATEFVDALVPHYIADFISWAAIGARTVESPTHRYMASGLSMPVGLKNGVDGNIEIAANAICSAQHPHVFLGVNDLGMISRVETRGNKDCHTVLRGGKEPNYHPSDIAATRSLLQRKQVKQAIVVDCSHGNSCKIWERQEDVLMSILDQRVCGATDLVGIMIESYLDAGSQNIVHPLKRGVSVTDACAPWDVTRQWLSILHSAF